MADFLKDNLTLLRQKFPDTASLLQAAPVEKNYSSTRSRSGPITGARIFPDGSTRNLHSTYDPVQEAARFIDTCLTNGDSNFLVTGFGLGYHLLELVRRVPASSRIVMIEKDPELARLALSHNDFSSVFNHPGVSFHVGVGPGDLEQILHDCRTDWSINGYATVGFKPLMDAEKEYYFAIQEGLKQIYQKARVDLGTQAVFSKTFYDNIFANGQHLLNSSGIRSLEQTLHGVPAIVVSAGPSLDKNISLLKNSADNILIVAVATALRPLVESGVKPDFVVAVDPDASTLQSFNLESIPEDLWLLYDPCVPPAVPGQFAGRRLAVDSKIHLSQWLATHNEEKGTFDNVSSVAHFAFYFARYLGCDPVILVGQDLSFNGHRLHCSGSFYSQANQDAIGPGRTLEALEKNKYQGYGPSLTPARNLFDGVAQTTTAMDTYKIQFADEFNAEGLTLNATEGGVLIPGAEHVTLREALNAHCRTNIRAIKKSALEKIEPARRSKNFSRSIQRQIEKFAHIAETLQGIRNRYPEEPGKIPDQAGFVRNMEDFYRKLLSDPETLQLMQGYLYSGFVEWNQRNHRISQAESTESAEKILKEKVRRDRDFMDVLTEAAGYLKSGFEKWAAL